MHSQSRQGIVFALGAFCLWGVFPLYFRLIGDSNAIEILGHRVVWSLFFCLLLIVGVRKLSLLRNALSNRRLLITLSAAAVAIGANWGIYIYAVNTDQVIEASLGYFINPLVTVVLGVVVLRERLRPLQWCAVAIGFFAVVVLTVGYGHAPLIAIALALSFGFYGLLKNKVGGKVDALSGLTTETLVLAPLAGLVIAWFGVTGRQTFTNDVPIEALLLVSTGIVTIIPLLLFAGAARRLPLSTIGLLQYLTPSLQLLCGIVILNEHMPPARWFGFALVWMALATLSFDGFRKARRRYSELRRVGLSGADLV